MEANEETNLENALRAYGERIRFRAKLARVQASLDMDAIRADARVYSAESQPEAGRVRALWQTYRTTLAVAASVAVLTTVGTILMYRSYQQRHQQQEQQEQQYSMLRRDIQAIRTSQRQMLSDLTGRSRSLSLNPGQVAGSGFLLTPDGYFVTNNHIVQDADSVYLQSGRGEVYKARIVHTDPAHDLAILRVSEDDSTFRAGPSLPYSFDAHPSDLSERVYTLGYPREEIVYGEGYLSSGTGYRGDSTAYQVAIGVNPGNSGGPLLDERGNVIGIISGKQTTSEGVSFAVKTGFLFQTIADIPADSLRGQPLHLNRKNALSRLPRKQQIKRIEPYVYQVKVFKHKE